MSATSLMVSSYLTDDKKNRTHNEQTRIFTDETRGVLWIYTYFRTNQAYYPDILLLARAIDTQVLSDNKAGIPELVHFQDLFLQF